MPGGRPAAILSFFLVLSIAASVLVLAPPVSAGPRVVPGGLAPHAPIDIRSDTDFTPANGVTGGSGTAVDPYIIEGWDIDASTAHGVGIRDTTAYFAIRKVFVHSGAPSYFGINLFNVSHGYVDNVTASGNWFGLLVDQSDDVTILRSNFSANAQTGVNLRLSSNVPVSDSEVSENGGMGILLFQITDAKVSNNSVSSNHGSGISTDRSVDVVIVDNRVSSNWDTGIDVKDSPNAKVLRNTLTSDGVFVFDSLMPADVSSYTITADNLVNGKPLRYYKDCSGVDIDGIVAGQVIFGNCTDVRVANIVFDDTDVGVEALFSSGIEIQGIRVTNGFFGVWLQLSTNVTIAGNNLSSFSSQSVNPAAGLVLFAVFNGDIRGNAFVASESGVVANFGSNVTFAENDVRNSDVGLRLAQVSGWRVHHNNFVGNAVQATDNAGPANAWDDGYPSGGNYWSDFAGVDLCSGPAQDVCPDPDGVGDTPYVIDADSQDRYPLMAPVANRAPTASFSVTPAVGTTGTVFLFDASASRDSEDPGERLSVRWDWDGDGTFDTAWTTAKIEQHRYTLAGFVYSVVLEVMDSGGLTNQMVRLVSVDDLAPTTSAIMEGTAGESGWNRSDVQVTLRGADDLSGVNVTAYRIDNGPWIAYSIPFVVSGDGVHLVDFFSTDRAGNVEATRSLTVRIDTTLPSLEMTAPPQAVTTSSVTVRWSGSDAVSGLSRFEVSVDGAPFESVGTSTSGTFVLADGTHTIRVRAWDVAGNVVERQVSLRVDTNFLSFSGPYGGAPTVAIIVVVAIAAALLLLRRRRRPPAKFEELVRVEPETSKPS